MVGTQKTGTIAANEVWGGEGFPAPIQLVGNVVVSSGVVLGILPGCEIISEGPFGLTVNGALQAGGDPRGRIVFRSWNRTRKGWTGIVWDQAGAGVDSVLEYVDVLDAEKGVRLVALPATGRLRALHVRLENCDVALADSLGAFVGEDVTLQRNRMGVSASATWGAGAFLDGRIRNNATGIYQSAGILTLSNQGIRMFGNRAAVDLGATATLNAEDVWWGSDTGPQHASVPGGLGDPITGSGVVDATPWTELGLYCTGDEVRTYCSRIVREVGTAGLDDLESLLPEADLEAIIRRAMSTVDGFYGAGHGGGRLEKPLFARGTETEEEVDAVRWGAPPYYRVRYRPIRSVTKVERRLGAAWETLPNDEWTGWWTSDDMTDEGRLRISARPTSPVSSYRVTYDHGHDVTPPDIRDATVKAAALEVLAAILPVGAADTFAPRTQRIADELDGTRKSLASERVGWST